MGIFSALLFSIFIGIVASEELPIDDYTVDSLVPVTIFVTADEYRACKEEGHCTFTPQSVSLNESEELSGKFVGKSYFEICRKIHFKMEKLESEHPEIKHLKLKLVQMFDKLSSELESSTEKGELIILKLLDIVKKLIEKLKMEFQEKEKIHKPDPISTLEPVTEEVTAEPGHPIFVGSLRGIPGIHFPNYTEIPITSFTCSDKKLIPGFYADLETGCQVFHLCYEHRRESFLCPIGTIFNQPILACDYWYSANCSLSQIYYEKPNKPEPEYIPEVLKEKKIGKHQKDESKAIMTDFLKFLPVKAKVMDIPEFGKPIKTQNLKPVTLKDTEAIADKIFDGILSLGGRLISKTSDMLRKMPEPKVEIPMKIKPEPFPIKGALVAKAFSAVPIGKVKIASAAKLGAATKLASAAASASGKAKLASLAAVPVIKSKVATAAKLGAATKMASAAAFASGKAKLASLAAVPVIKSKVTTAAKLGAATKMASAAAFASGKAKMASLAAAPVIKSKVASAAVLPMIKTKVALGTVPILKAKAASVKVPLVKGKLFALPLAKTKFGAAAAIPAFKVKKAAKAVPYIKMAALKPKFIVAPLKMKSAMALPLMKTKLAKAAAISPLTKKALALGYLKLLKAKKFTLMG